VELMKAILMEHSPLAVKLLKMAADAVNATNKNQ
jgi:hypothetical protein